MQTTRYPETGAYACAADLFAALQAAAADAPEFTLRAELLPEARRLQPFEELPAHEMRRPGFALVHGPVRPACEMLTFSYVATGTRCVMRLQCLKPRLLAMAETVRKNWALYGGGPKPAELAPVRKPRAQWRAVSVQVWREAIEDRDYTGAAVLADELGARYYSGQGRAAYALVAPEPVPGMPEGFHTARRCDGKWVAFEECTGLSIGCSYGAHGSRRAAQAAALAQWEDLDAEKRADILKRARDAAGDVATGADARAQWLREHGAAPVDIPADPAPAAPVQADPEPVAQPEPTHQAGGPILRDWQCAAMLASVPQVETEGEAASMEAAALAQFGVRDPLASVHLASFGDWHRETLASLRTPEPGPAAPAAPAMPRPVPAGLVDPSPWRDDENAAARARVYSVHCRTFTAAKVAAGPALADGVRLRRSVNEAGFPPDSAAMRRQVADWIRAERRAARVAALPPLPAPSGVQWTILHNVLAPLQNAAPDGIPCPDALRREAARIQAAGESVALACVGLPTLACALQTMANYASVAASLREMADTETARRGAHPPADDGHPAALAARMAECTMPAPTPIPPDAVPDALASLRRANGWTLLDMAAALGLEGENRADRIRELERGARPASGTVRQLLAYLVQDARKPGPDVDTMPAPDKAAVFAAQEKRGPP